MDGILTTRVSKIYNFDHKKSTAYDVINGKPWWTKVCWPMSPVNRGLSVLLFSNMTWHDVSWHLTSQVSGKKFSCHIAMNEKTKLFFFLFLYFNLILCPGCILFLLETSTDLQEREELFFVLFLDAECKN